MLYVVLGSALAVYGVLVGGLYLFQRHLLYFPGSGRPVLGELAALDVREVRVATTDGLSLMPLSITYSNVIRRALLAPG